MGNCFEAEKNEDEAANKPAEGEKDKGEVKPPTEEVVEATDDAFAEILMKEQNGYRLKHGADPLTLNQEMCKEAQKWANYLANANKLQHADTEDGENLAFAGPTLSPKQAADMWYNEIKDYDFSKPGFTGGTGHFTQVVWVGSKEFGAGVAKGSNGMYAVGRYRPAGNITNEGRFEANVLPEK